MLSEKLGYYEVDQIKFQNKIEAILHASKNGKLIKWNFFDKEFSESNWTDEPSLPIDEYYKLRAKQIRENYDYVVLRCSGGADSTNVLYSFINNNIFPDEIIGESPLSGLKNWNWNKTDTSVINTVSEHKYAQLPLLNSIANKFSKIKVTHVDNFERIYNPRPDSWFINCNDGIDYHASIEGTYHELPHLHKLAENGKTIAIVSGTDKPYIVLDENRNVYSSFSDLALNYLKIPLREKFINVHRVPFYWTPDFPEIIIKMSHIVARKAFGKSRDYILFASILNKIEQRKKIGQNNNINKNDVFKFLTRTLTEYVKGVNTNFNPGSSYQRKICPYIYPSTFNSQVFQADKNTVHQTFFSPLQDWFRILHKDSKAIQIIHSDFYNFYKMINSNYLNQSGTSFVDFNKLYKLGNVTDFANRE